MNYVVIDLNRTLRTEMCDVFYIGTYEKSTVHFQIMVGQEHKVQLGYSMGSNYY